MSASGAPPSEVSATRGAGPAAGSPRERRPAVVALAGEVEHAMFEVLDFDGQVLRVRTAFGLSLGEELSLKIEEIGRTIARVSGHDRSADRVITELTLVSGDSE